MKKEGGRKMKKRGDGGGEVGRNGKMTKVRDYG